MTQMDKLIQLFLSHPVEVRFEEVRRILIAFDFEEVRSKGSHHTFRHEDGRIQIVPKKDGQKVKGIYIKQIVKLLRLEE
ncbi:type II toxin-antitoxin system HicA family toxin [Sphaerospermopsis aphanizomenoides BCCUSP55]|uniref:type II toxin-antitoxin system HicA family toxin n=1 Tax=Sphaerospermopsis aphanizomenoides TaxID=459663 RepID=UPI00190685D4|nr:type II toxin-antitoxin system HicA family toxin [Sphaerospermopsis aphanizomenoides]MBK1989203.1 type II toxin-antitoxin system HicA family toxin [Sphaerospermopsis aphanizomenoides BCCUSP55]